MKKKAKSPVRKSTRESGGRLPNQRLNAEELRDWQALRVIYGGDGYGADKRTLRAIMNLAMHRPVAAVDAVDA